ncbi:MAG: hypothetical protein ACYC1C_20285 [Chloroflexota bacterium]
MNRGNDALGQLYWRDEILQIMYWLRGEGIGEKVSPRDLVNLLDLDEASTQRHLDRLVEAGYATRVSSVPALYRLTDQGVREGAHRFADEFAGLTGQAHGACDDPNCDCEALGPQACQTHAGNAS